MKAASQQILITADYLRDEVGKSTESMVERSVERSVPKRKELNPLVQFNPTIS